MIDNFTPAAPGFLAVAKDHDGALVSGPLIGWTLTDGDLAPVLARPDRGYLTPDAGAGWTVIQA